MSFKTCNQYFVWKSTLQGVIQIVLYSIKVNSNTLLYLLLYYTVILLKVCKLLNLFLYFFFLNKIETGSTFCNY